MPGSPRFRQIPSDPTRIRLNHLPPPIYTGSALAGSKFPGELLKVCWPIAALEVSTSKRMSSGSGAGFWPLLLRAMTRSIVSPS
jgi:hypothetical protein